MIRKLTLKKEREHETNEASIAGNVMRDLIAHVTNDNLIGRKIKSGELRKKMVEPPWKCPDMFTMTTIEMEHFTMEWLELKENPNEQKRPDKPVSFFFHAFFYSFMAAGISERCGMHTACLRDFTMKSAKG